MLYIKKYFTEGLIQVAILLSLSGLRVDVGLDPSLPFSWRQMILSPTSAPTPVQFHKLRNQLEDSHELPSKSMDLDGFSTTGRLLGLVRSLDRLQLPHTEVETWLVQRENDPLAVGRPEQLAPVLRAAEVLEQEQAAPYVSPRAALLEEEEQEDDKELRNVGGEAALEQQPSGTEPTHSRITPTDNYSQELELHWQDLLAIMEPENTDVDTTTSFDPETRSELLQWNSNHENPTGESDQQVLQTEPPLHSGLMWPSRYSALQPPLLPLMPTTNFDDQNSAMNERGTLKNMNGNEALSPPDHMGLLAEEPLEDFCMGANATLSLNPFSMSMPLEDFVDCVESCTCPRHERSPESRFNFNFQSLSLRENHMTQDILTSPSSALLEENDAEDQRGPPSPLNDFLEANAILDEISWLDGVLEEGFSDEMVARLEEDINLDEEIAQQFSHSMNNGEDDHRSPRAASSSGEQGEPTTHQQDGEDEAQDSDSGLSLDFSQEPHSPCVSEASSYSSSSCSSSDSSSSSLSITPSVFSDDEEEYAEDGLAASYMELTFKEEEQEEEMGAVGGFLQDVNKFVVPNYGDHKLFNGFPWLENIGHDHTYTQPWSSSNSPSTCKMTTKYPKSNLKPDSERPSRHISQTKLWSRDERRARALKIPFSNELMVNMPVEEFNELLSNYQLNEQQLNLVRDIRRRGKNKIAAQNCRKRKLGVLLGLEEDVSGLKRRRLHMLKQKQEVMKNLQEMRWQLDMLHQEVFSRLRDERGMPLDNAHNLLQFDANGTVTVASQQQGPRLPGTRDRTRKKQKDKKN